MKRRDFYIIAGVVALGLVLFLVSRFIKPAPVKSERQAISLTALGAFQSTQEGGKLVPADSYLRIKQGQDYYELVPLLAPGEITIKQEGGQVNLIYVDRDSAVMHSANCSNQDCVMQGEMTLENIATRVLRNYIICLPNQVSMELLTKQEAMDLVGETP